MTAATLIPVSEYLHTIYHPDCNYVDGELQKRNWGELDHSDLQWQLILILSAAGKKAIRVNPELRVQVNVARYRVPDICVLDAAAPNEQIVRHPPLLCIEILSPEDTLIRTRDKVHDFLTMGVREVWILDPRTRSILVCNGNTTVEHTTGQLEVPGTPITLDIAQTFSVLDEE